MGFNITWSKYSDPNITGFYEGMMYANSTTQNWFSPLILISLWVILFMTMRKMGDDKALATSSMITFIVTSMLRAMNLVSDIWMMIFFATTALTAILLFRGKD